MSKESSVFESAGFNGFCVGVIATAVLSFSVQTCYGNSDEDLERATQEAQIHNKQIYTQLEPEVSPFKGLILNTGDETFEFQSQQNGQAEACSGEYDVEDDVATLAGPIACTNTIPIGK